MDPQSNMVAVCEKVAAHMRNNILKLAFMAGKKGAHLGGCLSVVEILATLWCGKLKIKQGEPLWPDRDRFILSKGHASLALYTAMEAAGTISEEQLLTFGQNGSLLSTASSLVPGLGLEFSNGSLGLGLPYAVGLALAAKRLQKPHHIYVLMGDGECNEGSVWEAAMSAVHYQLSNLTVIVDYNRMQSDGNCSDIMNVQLAGIWKGFGWKVIVVEDGHNTDHLLAAFNQTRQEPLPLVILACTVKGKGISFMENNNKWHHGSLSGEDYDQAVKELTR
jgi:transketolase